VAGVTDRLRVLLVDDDALVRAGLSMMVGGAADLEVVGEAGDGEEVPAAIATHQPDVILMDLRMPRIDGITATERVRQRGGGPPVIVLTTFDTDANILDALRAGAAGFLVKDTPPAAIVDAIQRVVQGEPMLSPQVTRRLIAHAAERSTRRRQAGERLRHLSEREREVARAIAEGSSNAAIASDLNMSVATVKAHVTHIFTKLGLSNRTQIALLCHEADTTP
jgi:DNA-binding NarL/FixJ family response regulator